MKSEDIDWKILRGSLITFIVTLMLSGSLLYGGYYFKQQMQQEFNRTNAAFRSISSRYLAVDEEEKLIKSYLPRFVELYNNGVIGNEQRLNWVEVLRDAGEVMKLPSLSYQIESQQPYTPGYPLTLGKYRLYASKMSLNMSLLHEGDLFNLLDKLEQQARGTFSLSQCSIVQSGSVISENATTGNISVRCDLEWYTIRLADGGTIEI